MYLNFLIKTAVINAIIVIIVIIVLIAEGFTSQLFNCLFALKCYFDFHYSINVVFRFDSSKQPSSFKLLRKPF